MMLKSFTQNELRVPTRMACLYFATTYFYFPTPSFFNFQTLRFFNFQTLGFFDFPTTGFFVDRR